MRTGTIFVLQSLVAWEMSTKLFVFSLSRKESSEDIYHLLSCIFGHLQGCDVGTLQDLHLDLTKVFNKETTVCRLYQIENGSTLRHKQEIEKFLFI